MKVKVISVFRDKFTGKYYTPGEVIEVGEEARVLDMDCLLYTSPSPRD